MEEKIVSFRCSCGQELEASEADIGKNVGCPVCGEDLEIPDGVLSCPRCRQPLDSDAALCVKCGYNLNTGVLQATAFGKPDRENEERREGEFSIWNLFANSFSFPLKGAALGMTLSMPFIRFFAPFIPFVGSWVYFALFFSCLIDIMKTAAGGPRLSVDWPDFSGFWEEMLRPALAVFFSGIIILGIPFVGGLVLIYGWETIKVGSIGNFPGLIGGSVSALFLIFFCALYYPMSLVIVGIYGSVIAALNPVTIIKSILRIPAQYFPTAAFVWLNLIAVGLISSHLTKVPYGKVLVPLFEFYFLGVVFSQLGFMVYASRERLGWKTA